MNTKLFGLVAGPLSLLGASPVTSARAATFAFSFTSDGTGFSSNTPGTVTGLIFGLNENGSGQTPTAIEILSSLIERRAQLFMMEWAYA